MRQDLNDAVENLSAAIQASDGALRPLLIDIRQSELLDPAARRHYATQPLDAHFTALALLLATSPFGVMMGNVYMKMARHSVPMRLFAEEPQARAWLIKTLI